jgi:hypothetical protein
LKIVKKHIKVRQPRKKMVSRVFKTDYVGLQTMI